MDPLTFNSNLPPKLRSILHNACHLPLFLIKSIYFTLIGSRGQLKLGDEIVMNRTLDVTNQLIKGYGKICSEQLHLLSLRFSPLHQSIPLNQIKESITAPSLATTRIIVYKVSPPFSNQ